MSNRRSKLQTIIIYVGALLLFVETVAPVLWMAISSISPSTELISHPIHWWPESPTFERYMSVFGIGEVSFRGNTVAAPAAAFLKALLNSCIIATSATVLCIALAIPAVYAIARLDFAGRRHMVPMMIAFQMLPAIATVVPLFAIFRQLHLTDSLFALIITDTGVSLTYVIWLLVSYVRALPIELEEAARIDGRSSFGAYFHITLRLAVPGIIAAGTVAFLNAWNEFLFALVLTFTSASKPMPVVVSEFSTRFGIDYGMMMTGGVLASLPPVLLAMAFQKYLVSGLSSGAVKG